jgi:oligopeptidase B
MLKHAIFIGVFSMVLGGCACLKSAEKESSVAELDRPKAPVAKRVPRELIHHGHTRQDPYYWLRDDKREDTEILQYLKDENSYAETVLGPTKKLQEELFEEIKGRIKKDDASVPYLLDGYWYYTRYEKGKEYPIHCRKQGSLDRPEEIVLDVNNEAQGHAYYRAVGLKVSENNGLLAFGDDTLSRRIYTLRFRDLATGKVMDDKVEGTAGSYAWAADNKTIFYVKRDEKTLRAYQLWRHQLGRDPATDTLLFEEKDDTFHIGIRRTKSRKYLILRSDSTLVTEERVLRADDPKGTFVPFLPREAKHEYSVDHAGDRFYIRTNWQAENFRLMSASLAEGSDKSTWTSVIDHKSDVFLENFEAFKEFLVVNLRQEGLLELKVIPWKNPSAAHLIDFGEVAYSAELGVNPTYDTATLRYTYESMVTPDSVFDYDMVSRTKTLKKQDEVLGGYDPADYVTERLWIEARDGVKVPVSLVHRRDLDRSKPQPLYQYGYGSYGYSIDPYFAAARLSLIERGFIVAIAHIRGGQEMGRQWYENGKLLKKMNTFTDFIDVSKTLIEKGYTASDKLVAVGGSAGGLLVGAVANMAPETYHIVVAHVPFVDVVTTMLDESIPLTTFEYDEWGNPNDKTYYDYMLGYSPYDQVEEKDYPHMLVMTGLHDSQVQYWEPAKWVARLRHRKTDGNVLLFHTNMDAGHGGASGRFRKYKETALEYAFLLTRVR